MANVKFAILDGNFETNIFFGVSPNVPAFQKSQVLQVTLNF